MGRYMARIVMGQKTRFDKFFDPIDNAIYFLTDRPRGHKPGNDWTSEFGRTSYGQSGNRSALYPAGLSFRPIYSVRLPAYQPIAPTGGA
jgi:hypothetical protein